jgi:hypothetical protein
MNIPNTYRWFFYSNKIIYVFSPTNHRPGTAFSNIFFRETSHFAEFSLEFLGENDVSIFFHGKFRFSPTFLGGNFRGIFRGEKHTKNRPQISDQILDSKRSSLVLAWRRGLVVSSSLEALWVVGSNLYMVQAGR